MVALDEIVRAKRVPMPIQRASRSLRSQAKTKNFLPFKKTAGGAGGSRKNMKGNFMVLFPPLDVDNPMI